MSTRNAEEPARPSSLAAKRARKNARRTTGFAAAATFLDRNGVVLTASETQAAQMTIDLATRSVSEQEYAIWIPDNSEQFKEPDDPKP